MLASQLVRNIILMFTLTFIEPQEYPANQMSVSHPLDEPTEGNSDL